MQRASGVVSKRCGHACCRRCVAVQTSTKAGVCLAELDSQALGSLGVHIPQQLNQPVQYLIFIYFTVNNVSFEFMALGGSFLLISDR